MYIKITCWFKTRLLSHLCLYNVSEGIQWLAKYWVKQSLSLAFPRGLTHLTEVTDLQVQIRFFTNIDFMQYFSSGFLSNSPINFVVSCRFRLEIQCASATTAVVRTAALASARRGCPCRKQRARRSLIGVSPIGTPYPDSPPARATARRARSWSLPWGVRLNALWLLQPWGTLLQVKIAALHTALSKRCWERRGREMRTKEMRATRMKGSCSKRWFEMAFKT